MQSDTIVVRPYLESDRNAVIALWQRVFPDNPKHNDPAQDIDRKLQQDPELFFVAAQSSGSAHSHADGSADHIAGTAMGGWDGHRGWVYAVAVDPAQRRRSVGARLMNAVETALAERGCRKLNLQVRDGNTEATNFYSALGYAVEARVSMGKKLRP